MDTTSEVHRWGLAKFADTGGRGWGGSPGRRTRRSRLGGEDELGERTEELVRFRVAKVRRAEREALGAPSRRRTMTLRRTTLHAIVAVVTAALFSLSPESTHKAHHGPEDVLLADEEGALQHGVQPYGLKADNISLRLSGVRACAGQVGSRQQVVLSHS
jgi:hypothetical protein